MGKHPRVARGLHDATLNTELVREWWARWPNANIGIAVPDGMVVLDVDINDLDIALHGRSLPETAVAQTARGRHLWFRTAERVGPKTAIVPHVDVRGPGSYVIVPPSIHASGSTYKWLVPLDDGIAEAPSWLYDLTRKVGGEPGQRSDRGDGLIPEGSRHARLMALAGSMRRQGADGAELAAALRLANERRCVPPVGDDEIAAIARDAAEYEPEPDPVVTFAEFEDRGTATLSDLGEVEYVEDLIRPGRIAVWTAEEGTGKTYTVDCELSIRMAVVGGSVAGTWPVRRQGGVVFLSEMHPDDDFEYETTVLRSLGVDRVALSGKVFRLPMSTAAGGSPPLMDAAWRAWFVAECRQRAVVCAIFDTATGATRVDPWGPVMQQILASLRTMIADYPALAIVLVVHFRKPTGRHGRQISDVIGEWGRWADVTVLQERLDETRTKLTTMKRVRSPRSVIVERRGGLLVEPVEATRAGGTKVELEKVYAALVTKPGATYAELGNALGVSKDTAARYVSGLGSRVSVDASEATHRVYPAAAPQTAA